MNLNVIFSNKQYAVPIESLRIPVSKLLETLSLMTSIEQDGIKLLVSGVFIKQPEKSLESYGITSSSRIMMLGTVSETVQKLNDLLTKGQGILKIKDAKLREEEFTRLLIKVDEITGSEIVKKRRKEVVVMLQKMME